MSNQRTVKDFQYISNIKDQEALRKSFFNLARSTFGLSFLPWYHEGGWGTDYIPHVLADGQTVAANVSVNKMTFLHRGKRRQWIQLGTVMTHPDYRGNGLGRFLMEKILSVYKNSEAVYLFANDTVLDYYPKFGFQPSREFHCTFPLPELPVPLASVRKLDISDQRDRAMLLDYYQKGNPYSVFSMTENQGLLLFHCLNFLRDSIYYSAAYDMIVLAEFEGRTIVCHDLYGPGSAVPLNQVLCTVSMGRSETAALCFMPENTAGMDCVPWREEDTTLFFLDTGRQPFDREQLLFPTVSHA